MFNVIFSSLFFLSPFPVLSFAYFRFECDYSRRNNNFNLDAGTLSDLNYFSPRSSSSSKNPKCDNVKL